jgi:hypothetical protein
LIWINPVGRRTHSGLAPADAAATPPIDAAAVEPAVLDASTDAPIDAQIDAPNEAQIDAPIDAAAARPLYTITEALDDIAASPLEYIGTGPWFGNDSIKACAYRNTNVLVAYDYCTGREQVALGLHVISPTRGSLHVYVEAPKPISTLVRSDYLIFKIVGYPPTDPPPRLGFTYNELDGWHERRNTTDLAGVCWVSVDNAGCSPSMTDRLEAWKPSTKAFLDEPPSRWFALVRNLRTRTLRDLRGTK